MSGDISRRSLGEPHLNQPQDRPLHPATPPYGASYPAPPPPPYAPAPQGPPPTVMVTMSGRPEGQFQFDGGAGSYLLIGIGGFLVTVLTLGLAFPWAVTMRYRWQTQHTIINGRRLRFTGTGGGLFGNYIKWLFFIVITAGFYSFWVAPRITRWAVEHQDFA